MPDLMRSADARIWMVDVELESTLVRAGWVYFGPGTYPEFCELISGAERCRFQVPAFLQHVPGGHLTISEPDEPIDFIRVE